MKSERKRQVWMRALVGALAGVTLGLIITILISAVQGGGEYAPVVPALAAEVGSELGAVALQTALCALLGGVCGGASVVWQIDRWSIARQSGVYFLLLAAAMLPIAYVLHWMEHSLWGVVSYAGIFLGIFAAAWIGQYLALRAKFKRIQQKLDEEVGKN